MDVAEFVEAEQVQAGVAGDDPGELLVVGCLDELVDQRGGGDVADAAASLAHDELGREGVPVASIACLRLTRAYLLLSGPIAGESGTSSYG